MMSSLVLNNILRYQGNAIYGMVGMVSGTVINIGLTPLFLFVFDLGISGVALSTVISQLISFILLLVMNEKSGGIKIHIKYFKPAKYFMAEMARGGIPSLLRQGLISIAVIFLNKAASEYGDAAIAALSIVNRIMLFCGMIVVGFGQGFQPICGFNYGAKLYERVKIAFRFCNQVLVVFLLVMTLFFTIFASPIIAVFRKEDVEVIAIGAKALRFQCIALPLGGFLALCNMMLQAMGRAVKASIIASARQGLFFIPLVLILPRFFGLNGLMLTQAIADIMAFMVAVPLTIRVLKELK
jgi:Na+-driven multidrug efflux pump